MASFPGRLIQINVKMFKPADVWVAGRIISTENLHGKTQCFALCLGGSRWNSVLVHQRQYVVDSTVQSDLASRCTDRSTGDPTERRGRCASTLPAGCGGCRCRGCRLGCRRVLWRLWHWRLLRHLWRLPWRLLQRLCRWRLSWRLLRHLWRLPWWLLRRLRKPQLRNRTADAGSALLRRRLLWRLRRLCRKRLPWRLLRRLRQQRRLRQPQLRDRTADVDSAPLRLVKRAAFVAEHALSAQVVF